MQDVVVKHLMRYNLYLEFSFTFVIVNRGTGHETLPPSTALKLGWCVQNIFLFLSLSCNTSYFINLLHTKSSVLR